MTPTGPTPPIRDDSRRFTADSGRFAVATSGNRIGVSKCKVRGVVKWRVWWKENGRIKRAFYDSRRQAEARSALVRGQALSLRSALAAIPEQEQGKLLVLWQEAQRRGIDLLDFLSMSANAVKKSPAVGTVLDELIEAKRSAGRSETYLQALRWVLDDFCGGQSRTPMHRLGLPEVEAFLARKSPAYRSTLRARLSALFRFAVRKRYCDENPCARLEAGSYVKPPPQVFTVRDMQRCVRWLKRHRSDCLAWFVLSTFCGLRPEEAEKTTLECLNFDEGWIRIEAQTTKVRQRRVVYPRAEAMAYLKRVASRRSLPLSKNVRRGMVRDLRRALGWKVWPKDITRHSAASYWLAGGESVAKVADMLGNSEGVLRTHYRALVTTAQADQWWQVVAKLK